MATDLEVNASIIRAQRILRIEYGITAGDDRMAVEYALAEVLQDLMRFTERVDISFEDVLQQARDWEAM